MLNDMMEMILQLLNVVFFNQALQEREMRHYEVCIRVNNSRRHLSVDFDSCMFNASSLEQNLSKAVDGVFCLFIFEGDDDASGFKEDELNLTNEELEGVDEIRKAIREENELAKSLNSSASSSRVS